MSDGKKIALITGANKGIGFETARQLGAQNVVVLIGARDQAKGDEAARILQSEGIEAVSILLDVTDQASIARVASLVDETYGKLDILVNNAGISFKEGRMPPSELDVEILKKTYDTNVFGAFAVTRAMLPLLRRSEAGRIVNVSSSMGSLTLNSDPSSYYAQMPPLLAYCSSKTALNAITVFLARELRNTTIKVNSVSPGYVATDLNDHQGFLTAQQGAKLPVQFALLPADRPHGGFFGDEEGILPW
jgi:NAD(P)-dependent dehydrogenase (short-subunit alcohol dehydrogenase family)